MMCGVNRDGCAYSNDSRVFAKTGLKQRELLSPLLNRLWALHHVQGNSSSIRTVAEGQCFRVGLESGRLPIVVLACRHLTQKSYRFLVAALLASGLLA